MVPSNQPHGPRLHSARSEEHTSELQSLRHLVCRLLLEKKKNNNRNQLQEETLAARIQSAQYDNRNICRNVTSGTIDDSHKLKCDTHNLTNKSTHCHKCR